MRQATAKTLLTDLDRVDGPPECSEPLLSRSVFYPRSFSIEDALTVNVTVHRGTATVGGSCIEIAADHTRLILDLGLPLFDANRDPLDSYQLRRMSDAEISDSGMLPKVPGLFDGQSSPDAILLSHATTVDCTAVGVANWY